MFCQSVFFLTVGLSIVAAEIYPEATSLPEFETSTATASETAHELPTDATTANLESNAQTTEGQLLEESFTLSPTVEAVTPENERPIWVAPFFSDLGGVFGSHQLFAKRSTQGNENIQNETDASQSRESNATNHTTPEIVAPVDLETSIMAPETAYQLPVDDAAENWDTTEGTTQTEDSTTIATIEPTTSPTTNKPFIVAPFFSDLAGAFGSHQLLSKRSIQEDEQSRKVANFLEQYFNMHLGSEQFVGMSRGDSLGISGCVDKAPPGQCERLAEQGYCTLSYSESLRILMKLCQKTCKFC